MEKTTNYKLFKPELGDRVSIGDINENMDILDGKLKEVETIKIDKSRILSTKEELEAVTEPGFLVDALVVAQLNSDTKYPDYAHGVTYTQTTTVTLDVDTLIVCRVATNTSLQSQINISINGTEVMIDASFNLSYHGGTALPVKAGSVIVATLLGSSRVTFYPLTQ